MKNLLLLLAAASALASSPAAASPATKPIRNVVLVHGAFADGSGWKPVPDILIRDGYTVSVVQEPLTSLEEDVTATRRILDRQDGPAVVEMARHGNGLIPLAASKS